MEFFRNAKAIRLRSHHDKYLLAEEDEETVSQDRNGSSKTARWTVEFIQAQGESFIRLKSCFDKYLTASNSPFLLGMTGRKVLQTLPKRLDSSLEWEPVTDSCGKVKLRTRYGNYLRANGGVPPWRNSITHDVPHRTSTQEWVLWDVDVLEIQVRVDQKDTKPKPVHMPKPVPVPVPVPVPMPKPVPVAMPPPPPPPPTLIQEPSSPSSELSSSEPSTPSTPSSNSSFKLKHTDSSLNSLPKAVHGRLIYYTIADHRGSVDDSVEQLSFTFKGNEVDELKQKLEQETGMEDVVVCTRSPLNGNLYPLRLQLPPNNATMHLVLLPSSSKVARDFAKTGMQ